MKIENFAEVTGPAINDHHTAIPASSGPGQTRHHAAADIAKKASADNRAIRAATAAVVLGVGSH
jgi:hypothetical protein